MGQVRAFFRLAVKDGLKSAQVQHRGKTIVFDAVAAKESRLRLLRRLRRGLLLLIPLAGVAAVVSWRSGWLKWQYSPLPEADPAQVVRLVVEGREGTALYSYLQDRRYHDVPDEYGWTALHWAAFRQDAPMMTMLQASGASAAATTSHDWFVFPKGARPVDILRLSRRLGLRSGKTTAARIP